MALFPKKEIDAVLTALDIEQAVDDFNQKLYTKNHKIDVWMGIHYGKMIIGTIGEENRLDDTVISDTVNTSSRIETVCEKLEKTIIVSEEVVQKVQAAGTENSPAAFKFEQLEAVQVKGKEKPLQIYEVNKI